MFSAFYIVLMNILYTYIINPDPQMETTSQPSTPYTQLLILF